jgi:hypothetical protein
LQWFPSTESGLLFLQPCGGAMNIYTELPPLQNGYLRLLKVHPLSSSDEPVSCSLEVHQLHNGEKGPTFHCLSYTWGYPFPETTDQIDLFDDFATKLLRKSTLNKDETIGSIANNTQLEHRRYIVCNNQRKAVTHNLWDFLHHYARSQNPKLHEYLWVDALCIDQFNLPERSHQVNIMADIYKAAASVLIWLGVADEHTEPAIRIITEISALSPESRYNLHPRDLRESSSDVVHSIRYWQALFHFFHREWFNRAWIIQEVTFARQTEILVGEYSTLWANLTVVSHFLATSTWSAHFKSPGVSDSSKSVSSQLYNVPARLNASKRSSTTDGSNGFLYALIRARPSACQDPRDKVYSQLRLGNADIFPSYEASAAEVYITAAKLILERTDNLQVLTCVEGEQFQVVPGLPSWVPDWSVTDFLGLRITGYPQFNAATGRARKINISVADGRNILSLEVARLDDIVGVCETKRGLRENVVSSNFGQVVSNLAPIYHTEQSRDEVVWRTLMTNRENTSSHRIQFPASSGMEDPFRNWLLWRATVTLKDLDWPRRTALLSESNLPRITTAENTFPSIAQIEDCLKMYDNDPAYMEDLAYRASSYDFHYLHALLLRPFRTSQGYFGLGTQCLLEGDSIYLASGCRVPLIFRKVAGSTRHRLVGGAYVHGFMVGQGLMRGDLLWEMIDVE